LGQLYLLQTPNSVNNTRTRLGGGKQLPRLDRFARKADPLLTAEQREQDLDPLVRLHAGVEPKLSSERPDRDLHTGAHTRAAGLGELDQPVALARPKLSDDVVGDMCGSAPVHHQPVRTWRPVRGMPLKLDRNEAVAGEERRRDLDPTAAQDPLLAQAREVNLEPGQPQEMQGEPLLRQHVPRRRPVRHERLLGVTRLLGHPMGLWFWFRVGEIHLRGPDGAANGAIADRLTT